MSDPALRPGVDQKNLAETLQFDVNSSNRFWVGCQHSAHFLASQRTSDIADGDPCQAIEQTAWSLFLSDYSCFSFLIPAGYMRGEASITSLYVLLMHIRLAQSCRSKRYTLIAQLLVRSAYGNYRLCRPFSTPVDVCLYVFCLAQGGDSPDVLRGLAELTRYFILAENTIPERLFQNCEPQSMHGLFTSVRSEKAGTNMDLSSAQIQQMKEPEGNNPSGCLHSHSHVVTSVT